MAWFWPVSRKSAAMNNEKDPWGKRPNDQGPPDLDEVLANFQKKLSGMFGGGDNKGGGGKDANQGGNGPLIFLGLIALVAWLVYDSIHIIKEGDEGVVLRFGEQQATLPPGMHFRFPRPVESVEHISVDQVQEIRYGEQSSNTMLTADENMIDVKLTVQYRIKDSADFKFQISNIERVLQESIASAIREVVGRHAMEFTITENRQQVADEAKELLQKILDDYKTGVEVRQFALTDAQVPQQVQASLNDANKARQDRTRYKQQAEAYKLDITPKARAAAAEQIAHAKSASRSIEENAKRDVAPYTALLQQYRLAPEITRERMYLEANEEVYSKATKVIVDTGEGNSGMFYLPLDKLVQQHNQQSTASVAAQKSSADSVIRAAQDRRADERSKDSATEQNTNTRGYQNFGSGGLR